MNELKRVFLNSMPLFSTDLMNQQDHLLINKTYDNNMSNLEAAFESTAALAAATEHKYLFSSHYLTIVVAIIASLMALVTIVGNVLVITAFIIDKNLRKYSNYFILNLSFADLLIGLLIPPYAPFLLHNYNWQLGRFLCIIWLVLDYVVGSASVLCIVVISLDRYLMVSQGLKYISNQKISKAILIMLAVWTVAFLNYAPAIILWEIFSDDDDNKVINPNVCQVGFHNNLVYLTVTACVEFFVPLISICSLNMAVYLNIRKRSKGLIRSKPSLRSRKSLANTSSQITCVDAKSHMVDKVETTIETFAVKCSSTPDMKLNEADTSSLTNKEFEKGGIASELSTSRSISSLEDMNEQLDIVNTDNVPKESPLRCNHEPRMLQPVNIEVPTQSRISRFTTTSTLNSNIKRDKHLKKDKKAARSLFILVFTFVFCWVKIFIVKITIVSWFRRREFKKILKCKLIRNFICGIIFS